MSLCNTCGTELNPAHPFAVCPKCLFASALDAPSHLPPMAPAQSGASDRAGSRFAGQTFFQKYEILERIAQGGQGDIWKAWDLEMRRCVVMKRLGEQAFASPPAVYRFLAEAQIASQLEHPGILP